MLDGVTYSCSSQMPLCYWVTKSKAHKMQIFTFQDAEKAHFMLALWASCKLHNKSHTRYTSPTNLISYTILHATVLL